MIAPRLVPWPLWRACRLLAAQGLQHEWRRLRAIVLAEAHNGCAACRHRQRRGMVCDEAWHYDPDGPVSPYRVTSPLRRFQTALVMLLVVLATLSGACGQSEDVRWRDVTLELPSGWVVNELDQSRLSIANAPFPDLDAPAPPPDFPSDLRAAVFFTHEPNATAAAWRALVAEQHGSLDEDVRITIDGAPATRLVFTYDANGTLTREMVLLVPARELVGLFQPITPRFSQEGPSRFDQYRPMFDAIVESMDFGAPLGMGGGWD